MVLFKPPSNKNLSFPPPLLMLKIGSNVQNCRKTVFCYKKIKNKHYSCTFPL